MVLSYRGRENVYYLNLIGEVHPPFHYLNARLSCPPVAGRQHRVEEECDNAHYRHYYEWSHRTHGY